MTRELNVRITLSEDHQRWTEEEYENIICDAIEEKTSNYQVCVEAHTVAPESANPKEGECRYYYERKGNDLCERNDDYCVSACGEDRQKCKYYEPKREGK